MAGIDKTYVKTWENYSQIKEWVNSVGQVKDDFGNIFSPIDWFSDYTKEEFENIIEEERKQYKEYYSDPVHIQQRREWDGEDWEPEPEKIGEVCIWNTPTFLDIWLIRNCPLQIIQERLKQQYSSNYLEIKERRSSYDTYKRPAASFHFKITRVQSSPRIRAKDLKLYFHIQELDWDFNTEDGKWYNVLECKDIDFGSAYIQKPTRRKIARIIKKWDLPAGITLRAYSNYGHYFEILIKK